MKNIKLFLQNTNPSALSLQNGTFTNGLSYWTNSGGWIGTGSKAYATYGSTGTLTQTLGFTAGVTYQVSIYVKRQFNGKFLTSLGSVTVRVGDDSYVISDSGTFTFELTPTSGSDFVIEQSNNFRGYVGSVVVSSPTIYDYTPIDLNGQDINLNFNIKDILDLGSSMGNYSRNFTIIGNKENNQTLNYLYDINIIDTTIKFNHRVNAYIEINDIETFNGFFEISSAIYNEVTGYIDYQGVVYSNVKNLVSEMGDYNFFNNINPTKNIDFSKYDHILSWGNITSSWSNTGATTGYYYPLVNYGTMDGNSLKIKDLRPALHVKEVWDELFNKYGFTYTSNFLDSEIFTRMILLWSQKSIIDEDDLKIRNIAVGSYGDEELGNIRVQTVQDKTLNSDYNKVTTFSKVPLNNESATYNWFDTGNNFDTSNYYYIAPVSGNYNLAFAGKIIWQLYFNGTLASASAGAYQAKGTLKINTKLIRERGGVKKVLKSVQSSIFTNPRSLSSTIRGTKSFAGLAFQIPNIYATDNNINLVVGDKVYVEYDVDVTQFQFIIGSNGALLSPSNFDVNIKQVGLEDGTTVKTQFNITALQTGSNFFEGDVITMNSALPEMKQKDFYNGIINTFNLYVVADPSTPDNFIIEPRDDFYALTGGTYQAEVLDWTELLDRSQDVEIKRIDTLNEKNFRISYAEDIDKHNKDYKGYFNRVLGEVTIINTEFETNQFEEIILPFAMTPSDEIPGTNVPIPQMYSLNTQGELQSENYKCRILNKIYIRPTNGWTSGNVRLWSDLDEKYYILGRETGFAGQQNTYNFIPTASHFDNPLFDAFNLEFGSSYQYYQNIDNNTPTWNNLYRLYWQRTVDELMSTDSRLLTGYFKLDELEINKFKFNDTIQLDEQFYFVSSISDWNPDQLTKVELIKLATVYLPITDEEEEISNKSITGWDNFLWDTPKKWDKLQEIKSWNANGYETYGDLSRVDAPFYYLADAASATTTNLSGATIDTYNEFDRIGTKEIPNDIATDARGQVWGSDNTIEGASRDFIVVGKSNRIGTRVEGGIILGDNNTIAPNVQNAIIIGGTGITATQSNTTIIGGISKSQAMIAQPDIVEGSFNEVQGLFSAKIENVIEGGFNEVRAMGSYSITNIIDGGLN